MSEDKLQAAKLQKCKDEAAREFSYSEYNEITRNILSVPLGRLTKIIDRAMQLYAAQCVKDERERIKNAMPSDEEIHVYANTGLDLCWSDVQRLEAIEWYQSRLSQLIERGEG